MVDAPFKPGGWCWKHTVVDHKLPCRRLALVHNSVSSRGYGKVAKPSRHGRQCEVGCSNTAHCHKTMLKLTRPDLFLGRSKNAHGICNGLPKICLILGVVTGNTVPAASDIAAKVFAKIRNCRKRKISNFCENNFFKIRNFRKTLLCEVAVRHERDTESESHSSEVSHGPHHFATCDRTHKRGNMMR